MVSQWLVRASSARWPRYLLVAVLVGLAVELHGLLAAQHVNGALESGDVSGLVPLDTPRGQLARAYTLHAEGRADEALAAYGAVSPEAATEVQIVQRFNVANLHLEQAVAMERADEAQLATSLVELAKQSYREVLAREPEHWGARYNLSRALQMVPDLGAVDFEDDVMPERSPQAPRAAQALDQLP